MTTGSTVQVLNTLKKQLGDIINESDWLRKEISARSEMLKTIKRDNISVNDEIMVEKKKLTKFRSAKEETEGMPQVIDYVNQKRKEYEVETKIKNWDRTIIIRGNCRYDHFTNVVPRPWAADLGLPQSRK